VANGVGALYRNTSGGKNVAGGYHALISNTSGHGNVALGHEAGDNLTTGSNNIALAARGVAGESGKIRIGRGGTHNAAFLAGVNGVSIAGPTKPVLVNSAGQLGTATASSAALKADVKPLVSLDSGRLLDLRPVSCYKRGGNTRQFGLIAEEVAKSFPQLIQYGRNGKPAGVHYDQLPPLLLDLAQRQQRRLERQAATNRRLERRLDEQARQLRADTRQLRDLTRQLAEVRAQISKGG
jgi:hypothetical protein